MDSETNNPIINPEPPKKNWFSKYHILGYVFLFAVLAAVVSVVYYLQISNQPINTSPIVHKPKIDQIADWQEFKNDIFKIKYPSNWFTSSQDKNGLIYVKFSNYEMKESAPISCDRASFVVQIERNGNPKKLPIQDWYDQNLKNNVSNEPEKAEKILINSYPAIKFDVAEVCGKNTHNSIASGSNIVDLIFPTLQPQYETTYNQILSTFKFIDKNNSKILLTPENYSQYDGTPITCNDIEFNYDKPNTKITYTSIEKGLSFEIPYNPDWGNNKFEINPYDEFLQSDSELGKTDGGLIYGYIAPMESCWSRQYHMIFYPTSHLING